MSKPGLQALLAPKEKRSSTDQGGEKMKVIENYKTAIENSDESLLKEVFAPQVRIEIPAGASLDHPVNTASYIMSQVAKTAPGIKCILTADAGNNWYFLGFEGQIEGQKLQAVDQVSFPRRACIRLPRRWCLPAMVSASSSVTNLAWR
jgi:hypothetical protein